MQHLAARAALAPDVADGLSTSVSRQEVEEALRTDNGPLDLVLDVTRFSDSEPAETRSVVVGWERSDLEQLLEQTEGEQVLLTFDREALQQAAEADVEAHGFREKVLVLAVAATAATGAAANAGAQTVGGPDDRSVSRATSLTAPSPDDRAVSRATSLSAPSLGSADDRAVSRATPAASDPAAISASGPDDRSVSRATPVSAPATGASPDDRSFARTTPVSAPDSTPISISGPDDRAVSRATPVSAPAEAGSPDDRAFARATPIPAPDTTGGGISISAPSPAETATIAGMVALAITGAAFVVAGRRRLDPT